MPASSADPASAAVVLGSVDARYAPSRAGGSAVDALIDVTLRVERGERVALLGASGAGKSTLLDVVAGLVAPAAGSVEVLGTSLASLGGRPLRRHRSRVGVVRQQHGLPPSMRVVHNVNAGRLGRWSTGRALASLVVPLGRGEVEAVLDQVGLEGVIDRRTGDLSGGQQQRVAVARILLQHPELILADEPVSAVDPRLSTDVVTALCDRSAPAVRNRTTIISLHDPDLARRHVDRIVGIGAGRIWFDAPVDAVDDRMIDDLYRVAV